MLRVCSNKASGKDITTPQLTELLRFARHGDTVVVHSMDRLARNLDDLRGLVESLTRKGRAGGVRQREPGPVPSLGNASGKASPRPISAAPTKDEKDLTPERAAERVQRAGSGVPKAVLAREYETSRETVYQYVRHAKLA